MYALTTALAAWDDPSAANPRRALHTFGETCRVAALLRDHVLKVDNRRKVGFRRRKRCTG